jgi:hypothetical protein
MNLVKLDNDQDKYTLMILSAIGIIFLVYFTSMLRYGFDFTDEGWHVMMMAHPKEDPSLHILTGFVYHPLYNLLNGNLFLLRAINFTIFILININLCRLFILYIAPQDAPKISKIKLWALALLLSCGSLSYFLSYLPSPNYNLLNFMSISIVGTGILIIGNNRQNAAPFMWGWVICAIGCYLSFMARPQTCVALILLVIVWSVASSYFKLNGLLAAAAVSFSLLLITSFWIDDSPAAFVQRFLEALKRETMSQSHQVFHPVVLDLALAYRITSPALLTAFLLLAFYVVILSTARERISSRISSYIILAALPAFFIFIMTYKSYWWFNYFAGYLILSPVIGLFISAFFNKNATITAGNKKLYFLSIIFFLFSVVYGLGSANSVFVMMSLSSFFLLLGSLTLLTCFTSSRCFYFQIFAISATNLIISMGIIHTTLARPYRQPYPIWDNNVTISIQDGKGQLILSPIVAGYITKIRAVAKSHGFEPGTPIIDLSALIPGTIYVLDGYTPKNLWIIGGNDRTEFYKYLFSTMPCEEITKAWLLWDETLRKESINPTILLESGLDPESDYSVIGKVLFPKWFNVDGYYLAIHYLFKPAKNHDLLLTACYKARGISKPEN